MMGTLHENVCTFKILSRCIIFRVRNISEKVIENRNTHFTFNNLFFSEILTDYQLMLRNVLESETPQLTM